MGPKTGLDTGVRGKILCLYRGSISVSPVSSQALYSLSYPGHYPLSKYILYIHNVAELAEFLSLFDSLSLN
jgi:hypothetical protein